MLSAVCVSGSRLGRVAPSGFHPTFTSPTRPVQIIHTPSISCLYSTSTSASKKTPLSALPPLPEQSEWRSIFNPPGSSVALRDRISIRNPQTARTLAEHFIKWTTPLLKADETMGKGKVAKGAPKVIIEAFPGPGALTRALLTLPRDSFDKLIVLEAYPGYLEFLKPLEQVDDRVKVLPYSGYTWDTYSMLDEQGWLDDVPRLAWNDGVHPSLQFISHVPHSVVGEQLVNQFLRCIPDKTWLFKYGRVPLNLIMGESLWDPLMTTMAHSDVYPLLSVPCTFGERSSAGPTDPARCKLSIIADATADLSLSLPPGRLLPYDDHFHPTMSKAAKPTVMKKPEARKLGHPMVGVSVLPREEQVIRDGMLEKWDYCLRRLFVLKGQSLGAAIGSLAPGAQVLLKVLTNPSLPPEERLDVSKQVRRLDIKDWALVLRAFNEWPFAPEDLLIHDTYNPSPRETILQ